MIVPPGRPGGNHSHNSSPILDEPVASQKYAVWMVAVGQVVSKGGERMRNRVFPSLMIVLIVLLASCTPAPSPEMTLSVSASPLAPCALASVHVHLVNPGRQEWSEYKLLLFNWQEDEGSWELHPLPAGESWENTLGFIREVPLSLPAGQGFESNIPWLVGSLNNQGKGYRLQAFLLSPGGKTVAAASIPVEFVLPTVTLEVSPTRLTLNSTAAIALQVSNPSSAGLACVMWISYGITGEDQTIIKMIPVPIDPGGTFRQEISWTVDYIEVYEENEVKAMLLVPSMPVQDLQEVADMLLAPDKYDRPMSEVASARVTVVLFQP